MARVCQTHEFGKAAERGLAFGLWKSVYDHAPIGVVERNAPSGTDAAAANNDG